jgi:hypothetical protein
MVAIPVRDREPARLVATLSSLAWQTRPPARVVIVSHGSRPEIDDGLARLCAGARAELHRIAEPAAPWCKPAALNHAISLCGEAFLMALDADMILAPNFLATVSAAIAEAQDPGAIVLCRSTDLPRALRLPSDPGRVKAGFDQLARAGRLRGRWGCGGVQAAPVAFLRAVGGYDERFVWWGEEDRELLMRAEAFGLSPVWIDGQTTMLHQWHPHALEEGDADARRKKRAALERNRALHRALREAIAAAR